LVENKIKRIAYAAVIPKFVMQLMQLESQKLTVMEIIPVILPISIM
jgi:hypothetical protein